MEHYTTKVDGNQGHHGALVLDRLAVKKGNLHKADRLEAMDFPFLFESA